MKVYAWEESIVSWARQLPHSGPLFYFFQFWSEYKISFPILFLLVVTLGIEFGWKKLVPPILLSILAVAAGDLISFRVVKFLIERPRPDYIHEQLCNSSPCWGFVSSHCTNVAAVALILCLYNKRNALWTIPSVIFVGLSRIYLIDHYPLDVIGGIVLGVLIGLIIYIVYLQTQIIRQRQASL
jgi:undecaprenyl-diphosphatase